MDSAKLCTVIQGTTDIRCKAKREPGFYWVKRSIMWAGPPIKFEEVWLIAEYKWGRWHLPGEMPDYGDSYFLEIDDKPQVKV